MNSAVFLMRMFALVYGVIALITAEHRESIELISDIKGILEQISSSNGLKESWGKYRKMFAYARDISYEDIIEVLKVILSEHEVV